MIGALILGYFFFFAITLGAQEEDKVSDRKKFFRALYFVCSVAALGYCADLAVRAAVDFARGLV